MATEVDTQMLEESLDLLQEELVCQEGDEYRMKETGTSLLSSHSTFISFPQCSGACYAARRSLLRQRGSCSCLLQP